MVAAASDAYQTVETAAYVGAERLLLSELKTLKAGWHIPNDRCMVTLSPEYDEGIGLLCVGEGCGTQIARKQIQLILSS